MPRTPGSKNMNRETFARMQTLERQGMARAQIARTLGLSASTVTKWLNGTQQRWYRDRAAGKHDIPPPLLRDGLLVEARKALDDFRYFRKRYFDRATPNFQVEVANLISSLRREEELLAFWPPGFGKTTTVTHDYPIWRMLKARVNEERFACLLISKSETLGRSFLRRIKRTLESNVKLQEDFGWFKPEQPDTWTNNQLQVDGFDPEKQGKEPTFIAAGAGTHIYGWRVDLIICDDLIDKESATNVERQETLQQWFHEEVESRLEKGGALAMCGTRFSMSDLYGRLLALRDDETGASPYRVVQFPVHDDAKCPGPAGPHKEYPDGCHLWPEQKTYKWLMQQRTKMGTARFDFVYNQVESSTDDNLLRKEWIEAAKDTSRVMWDIPRGTKIVCTLDPSPTNYACAQVWAFDPQTLMRYLVAVERRRMKVGDMISLMAEWTHRLRQMGREPTWVFEQNAAQRWLFQSMDYRLLRERTGIRVLAHTTHRNKTDPEYGVQTLAPIYEFNQVSIPWGSPEDRRVLGFFISELITYPNGSTDDGVMAQWFFEWNIRKIRTRTMPAYTEPSWAPDYLKDTRSMKRVSRVV